MLHQSIQFRNKPDNQFQNALRKNISHYFKRSGLSKHATFPMVLKTVIFLAGYFLPYFLMLFIPLPGWTYIILTLVMSFSLAGIGMAVMHDANHGAYSSNKNINHLFGYTINLIGGNRFNWLIQHNVKHHTYTNIYGADEDLHTGGIIRFSPHAPWRWCHRFQHIYSWFLYSLTTVTWLTTKDFKQLTDLYKQQQITKGTLVKELGRLILWKGFYYLYMLAIPIWVMPLPPAYIIAGFAGMHLVAGFVLGVTFQLAHVVELTGHSSISQPVVEDSWIAHQTRTTANFAGKSKFLTWYLGGLNFQIEHHLFPHICHIHYKRMSPIVKATVLANNLPYHEHATLLLAVKSHYRMLKSLSVKPVERAMDS